MSTHRVSKARVQTQVNSIQSNSTCYQKLDNTYGNRYSSDRLGEFKIVKSMSSSLLRNEEGNNIITSSSTTILNITAVDGNTLTLNSLPQNLICSTSIDWFIQNLDPSNFNYGEPSYYGDYLVQDKIASFDFDNNKVTLVDATGFDVGDDVCLYSPWANYEFMPGQEDAGIINTVGAAAWRNHYNSSGPSWYDESNNRYVVLINGRTVADDIQVGFAYSTDLINWTIGNGDVPIVELSDHASFAQFVMAQGNVIELENGKVAFSTFGRDAEGINTVNIIQMNKDCTGIVISDGVTDVLTYGSGLAYYNGKYVLLVINADFALNLFRVEMWESDTIDSGYTKTCDFFTTEYDGNDSVWLEGHCDNVTPFVENGKLYCITAGTQRYTISGIQGNRQYGLMEYDAETETWSIVNDYAPEIIHPMYFYNIASEDYGWAGGHTGGYGSIIKKDGHCYFFCSFLYTAGTYQVAALELKNNT